MRHNVCLCETQRTLSVYTNIKYKINTVYKYAQKQPMDAQNRTQTSRVGQTPNTDCVIYNKRAYYVRTELEFKRYL